MSGVISSLSAGYVVVLLGGNIRVSRLPHQVFIESIPLTVYSFT